MDPEKQRTHDVKNVPVLAKVQGAHVPDLALRITSRGLLLLTKCKHRNFAPSAVFYDRTVDTLACHYGFISITFVPRSFLDSRA